MCRNESKKCETRSEFHKKFGAVYNISNSNNWLDEFFPIKNERFYSIKENCKIVSEKCKNRTEFHNRFRPAFNTSKKNNWLDEFFPNR